MSQFRTLSAVEQVVEHLRKELYHGAWLGTMPGGDRLAKDLAIGRNTVEVALQQLEKEGLLVGQGVRRRRLIELPQHKARTSLRVAILRFEVEDNSQDSIIEVEHRLSAAGHEPFYATKSLNDLGMDVKQVARFVKQTEADAWVIVAGSREVLEWFAKRPEPAFALYGRRQNVDIASVGPQTIPTMVSIARRLVELGHHRIVMLSRRDRRLPKPAKFERAFLGELEALGLEVGSYNLPDWEETRQGLHRRLDSLFSLTPPTALIINEPPLFNAVLLYLAGRGIRIPKNVSIVCTDPDRSFNWCEPPVSHITWDISKAASRVVRWAANVNLGKEDRHQTDIKAEFVEGGTIGPARE
jgi:DNA-binding LacI/PurR family transcriptional regulator/biotin operon repressor